MIRREPPRKAAPSSRKRRKTSRGTLAEEQLRIGELAKATGTQVETIRFYEREGLLSEGGRTDANYRVYADAHVKQLIFIRQCRSLDTPLDVIRALLRCRDRPRKSRDANQLLDACIAQTAMRILELRQLRKELTALKRQTAGKTGSSIAG